MNKKFVKVSALAFVLAMGAGCQQITREEFDNALNLFYNLGLNSGYIQEME